MKADSNLHTIAGKSVVARTEKRYKEYRTKWEENPQKAIVEDFPLHVDLEPTSSCNLKCRFCATAYNRYNGGFMQKDLWERIINECGRNNLYSLRFTYRGEPLLHPQILEMVAYAKKAGIMDVYLTTNATKLTREMAHGLIEAGLDRISLSVDGFNKETYEKYRVGSNWDLVLGNVMELHKVKRERRSEKPFVRIQTVLVPEIVGREQEYAWFWGNYVDEVAFLDMKQETENGIHTGIINKWGCPYPWQRLTVTWDGKILPCVFDVFEWSSLGVYSEISLKDAWHSKRLEKFRELHKSGWAHDIPSCDRCPQRAMEIKKENKHGC